MKELRKSQVFNVCVGVLMQVYCMFPWILVDNEKVNIFTYLYLYIKNREHFTVFQSAFLKYDDELQHLSENNRKEWMIEAGAVADYFLMALTVIILIQFLNLLYALFFVKGHRVRALLAYTRIILLLFLSGVVGNIVQEASGYFISGSGMKSRIDYFSGIVFIYLILFILAEFLLLVIGRFLKDSEVTAYLLETERREAQLHRQMAMENYIANLERMVDEMRAFQHDYKNIMSTMSGYIRENQIDKLKDFFREKIQSASESSEMQMKAWQSLRNIGPMELKGFLYEKMLLVMAHKISAQVDISENLDVEYNDMADLIRILGIFIDNAVEEAEKTAGGKIEIVIARTRGGVLFRIENNLMEKPALSRLTEKGYTTKGEGRGMGLYWAEERINSHEDMFHELKVTDEKFIQLLEIIVSPGA